MKTSFGDRFHFAQPASPSGPRLSRAGFLAGACAALTSLAGARRSSAASAPRILLLETFDVPVILAHTRYFLSALEKRGYSRSSVTTLKAQGDSKRATLLLTDAIKRNAPGVVVANATLAAQAAYAVTKPLKIPLIFFVVSDPVGAGLVRELDVPSQDLTCGIVHSVPRDTKLEMVMRVLKPLPRNPRVVRFGYIHSTYPSATGDLRMLKQAAQKRGDVEFVPFEIPYDTKHFDVAQTLSQLVKGIVALEASIDYWWISQDPVAELAEFVQTIEEHSVHPVICGTNVENTKTGALLHIAADTAAGASETAEMVDLVLKGTAVGTIPVHSPAKIDFGVNLTTATRTGIPIPSDLLELAGAQIFR